jgi:hypothetical protein
MANSPLLCKNLYEQWQVPETNFIPGYSILIMVPGDLPVFLKIALEVCATQNPEYQVETFVVPDTIVPGTLENFENLIQNYRSSPVRLVQLKPSELLLTRQAIGPHVNCWLQFIRGSEQVRTTHALWHDADLFITEADFLRKHYEMCVKQNLACLGVNKSWDRWYQANGYDHIVSTWELMFSIQWLRSFSPWYHRGHENNIAGKTHIFDITLWPQCHTPPEQIGRHEQELGFVHFNYVICTYRWFQQHKGPYEDEYFRLLLIRLLINAFDSANWPYELPSLADLYKGIEDSSMPVTYLQDFTRRQYKGFRVKLQRLLDSGLLDDQKLSIIDTGVQPFDESFWTPSLR